MKHGFSGLKILLIDYFSIFHLTKIPCFGDYIHKLFLLDKTFDTLIGSYVDDKIGIAEDFLSSALAAHLTENVHRLYTGNQLQAAGTGTGVVDRTKLFRSDIIYWLDRTHGDQYENEFLDLVDEFVRHLNATCYTGITGYEFHYAMYAQGSFYKKHLDQFRDNQSRQYSLIMYLNEGWVDGDGGELCIHHGESVQKIAPGNRKAVFFKSSELEHEVLVTNKPRLSITGWLKKD